MRQQSARTSPYKIAQPVFKSVQLEDLPGSAILLSALKPLESELLRRKLVGNGADAPHPLWFLAETERNVFLWRSGLSLADHERFEFWVEIPKLIEKRRGQMQRGLSEPGFGNPFLGTDESSPADCAGERRYLDDIEASFNRIYVQAFELSLIGRTVQREVLRNELPIILLPYQRS